MKRKYSFIFLLYCFCALSPNWSNAQAYIETYALNNWQIDLAMSGNHFVVVETNPTVYTKTDSKWVLMQELLPDSDVDRHVNGFFGSSVDIQDNTIVVNAENSVYVYELVDGTWLKTYRFEIPESALGEYPIVRRNPLDIVINGDQIVAGTGFSNQYYGGGTLSFYERKGTDASGTALWEYTADFFRRGGGFGKELEISQEHLVVSTQGLGEVFTFKQISNEWVLAGELPLTNFPFWVPLFLEGDLLYFIDSSGLNFQIYSLADATPSLVSSTPVEFDVLDENKQHPRDIIKVGNAIYLVYQHQVIVYELDGETPRFLYRIRDPGGITRRCCDLIAASENTLLLGGQLELHEFDISLNTGVPVQTSPADNTTNILRESATLTWTSVPDASSYQVQLWSYSFQGEKLLASFTTQETSVAVALPDYNATYSWWVKSLTNDGMSIWSPVFSFVTETEPNNTSAWETLFGSFGADSTVLALEEDWDNSMYAGGNFLHAGIQSIPYMAKWTGSQWSALGEGVYGPVRKMVFNRRLRDLYVIGDFNRAGSIDVQGFARWRVHQNTWDNPLENAIEGVPVDISWDYSIGNVGGFYLATHDETANNKSRLYRYELSNGFDLPIVETGFWQFADSINVLDALDGQVLIGFDHPNSGFGSPQTCEFAGCVALLNGLQPFSLDPDFPADSLSGIDHVAIAFGDYYVAGDFNLHGSAGSIAHLGKYDGSEWQGIDATLNGPVTLLETACEDNCERFATSQQLLYIGSAAAPHIGLWNNNTFLIPDGGTNGPVRAAVGSYFAGDFTQAGGVSSYNIGLWRGALPVNKEEEIKPISTASASVYPNPANQVFTIGFTLASSVPVRIDVFDLLGRIVKQVNRGVMLAGEHTQTIDISHFAAGTYFIVVQQGQHRETIPVSVKR